MKYGTGNRDYTLARLDHAVKLGRRGRPTKEEQKNKGCNATLKRGTADYWEARLARDGFDELAERVRGGELLREMADKKERREHSQRSRGATSEMLPP